MSNKSNVKECFLFNESLYKKHMWISRDKCYVLTNDDKFLIYELYVEPIEKDLDDEEINYIKPEDVNLELLEKLTSNYEQINYDEYEYLGNIFEIINVRDIKEDKDSIKIYCDYLDHKKKIGYINQYMVIYKCYDNYKKILSYLNELYKNEKKELKYEKVEDRVSLDLSQSICKSKITNIIFLFFVSLFISKYLKYISTFVMPFFNIYYVACLLILKKAKKQIEAKDDIELMNKNIKKFSIYTILSYVFTILSVILNKLLLGFVIIINFIFYTIVFLEHKSKNKHL